MAPTTKSLLQRTKNFIKRILRTQGTPMEFCTNCLKSISEDELHFEAKNQKKQIVILCRSCFYESDYISNEMKQDFREYEEREKKH